MSEEPEVVEVEAGAEPEQTVEERALGMGWTPKEEFKGRPERWIDAETFVKRGEEFLPILQANNKALARETEASKKELAELRKSVSEMREFYSKSEERAYQKAVRDLQSQLEDAAANGDVEGVKAVTKEITALEKEASAKPKDGPQDEPDVLKAWKAENAWFKPDTVMGKAAAAVADELISKGMKDPADYLPEVTKRMKAEFPEKFENPRRREPGAVEGGASAPRKGGKTRSDLPPEARSMMDKWVKQGLMTEAEYLKGYQW